MKSWPLKGSTWAWVVQVISHSRTLRQGGNKYPGPRGRAGATGWMPVPPCRKIRNPQWFLFSMARGTGLPVASFNAFDNLIL